MRRLVVVSFSKCIFMVTEKFWNMVFTVKRIFSTLMGKFGPEKPELLV